MSQFRNLWHSGLILQKHGIADYTIFNRCCKMARHCSTSNNIVKPIKPAQQENQSKKQKSKNKHVTLGELRHQEAVAFMENLNPEMQEKEKRLLTMIDILKHETTQVPDNLTVVHMHQLLLNCSTYPSVKHYMQHLCHVKERNRGHEAEKQALAKMTRSDKEEEDCMNKYYLSEYVALRDKVNRVALPMRGFMHGNPLIFDVGFDISDREQAKVFSHINLCYGINKKHRDGFHLHFTGIMKNKPLYQLYENGMIKYMMADFHEENFWDVFPRERLVYLSSNGPKLREYNGNDIYVLGGLVDIKDHSPRSYARAKELGIRCGSFPIDDYFQKAESRKKSLNLATSLDIMLSANLNHCWKQAMYDALPETYVRMQDEYSYTTEETDDRHQYRTLNKSLSSNV